MFTADQIRTAKSVKLATQMIRENLNESDHWLHRAILAIYARQTAQEQAAEHTRDNNGVGFSGLDGQILSSFAKSIERWQAGRSSYNTPLSAKQTACARKLMGKYAGQLAGIARPRATPVLEAAVS